MNFDQVISERELKKHLRNERKGLGCLRINSGLAWRKKLGPLRSRTVSGLDLKTIEPFEFSYSNYLFMQTVRWLMRQAA